MSYVLELQVLAGEPGNGPDSPSTWSFAWCFSSTSIVVCFTPEA
jgi:hypothetical protein